MPEPFIFTGVPFAISSLKTGSSLNLKLLKKTAPDGEDYKNLYQYAMLVDKVKEFNKLVKDLTIALDAKVRSKYADLTIEEIKE